MVESTEDRATNDAADGTRVVVSGNRCITIQCLMGPDRMIIGQVLLDNSSKVTLVQDDDVVQALTAECPVDALDERILPGRPRADQKFIDAHPSHSVGEVVAVDTVTVAEKVLGFRAIARKSLDDLPSCPASGGVFGNVEMNDLAAVVPEDDETVEQSKTDCRHDKEITCDGHSDVVP